jgi:beta-phosphoglucomutase
MDKSCRWDIFLGKRWILLDFDGLLVDTERLHYRAYGQMCANFGHNLPFSFGQFCSLAHVSATALKEGIYQEIPALKNKLWDDLYQEKKRCYLELLARGELTLMPYVEPFLRKIQALGLCPSVVTHSPKEQILAIRNILPSLKVIPYWFTREDYNQPKPAPDGYLHAMKAIGATPDKTIGFEDTLRGYLSLEAAGVKGFVVSSIVDDCMQSKLQQRGASLLPSFAYFFDESIQ